MIISEGKICLNCQKPIRGRADKKFCDDYCRNQYNNHLKSASNNCIRNINHALKKNRNILQNLLAEQETCRVTREKLLVSGFLFQYHTHTLSTRNRNNRYSFCYDYGYLSLDDGQFLIVKKRN